MEIRSLPTWPMPVLQVVVVVVAMAVVKVVMVGDINREDMAVVISKEDMVEVDVEACLVILM